MVQGKLMSDDLVSIITPAYNSESTIEATINSVLFQTYTNWEMIIVDDCSVDNTVSMVTKFSQEDERIILIELKANRGVANARNIAIKKANGRYIAFLDSDDLWTADKLLWQISFMRAKGCFFSYTAYEIIDVNGRELDQVVAAPLMQRYQDLVKKNTIGCLTVIIDVKEVADIEMPAIDHEDFALWLTILRRGYVAYGLDENLAKYRQHEESLSSNKLKTVGWVWKIYRENQNIGVFLSAIYVAHFIVRSVAKYQRLGLLGEAAGILKGKVG